MKASPARMTIELPQNVKERLEGLARATERSEARLAVEAISSYVELQELQIQQIQAGVRDADAGNFASDDEVAAVLNKWTQARQVDAQGRGDEACRKIRER
jgi:RHH-type rel operon transcriptional repressor/antitoxin RelB